MCDTHKHATCSDPAFDTERCKCKAAVLQAYGILYETGNGKKTAIDAATRVYRFHHPEDSAATSRLTVERWVNEGRFH